MLRKAIAKYADTLDMWADTYTRHAVILQAVAHRLRHILDNTPTLSTEYGVMVDGRIVPVESIDNSGEYYIRQVTNWERVYVPDD